MNKKQTDIDVLLDKREVQIAGETIIVCEYTFADAMNFYHDIDVLASALSLLFAQKEEVGLCDIDPIVANNYPLIQRLVSYSINKPVSWLDLISASHGQMLLDYWWTVNGAFFISAAMRKSPMQEETPSTGEKSSQHLSDMDTTPSS